MFAPLKQFHRDIYVDGSQWGKIETCGDLKNRKFYKVDRYAGNPTVSNEVYQICDFSKLNAAKRFVKDWVNFDLDTALTNAGL